MFDLGTQELVVIFVVALLVVGPKNLPELARKMGKGIGRLKEAMFDIKAEVDRETGLADLREGVNGVKEDLSFNPPEKKTEETPVVPPPAQEQGGGSETPNAESAYDESQGPAQDERKD